MTNEEQDTILLEEDSPISATPKRKKVKVLVAIIIALLIVAGIAIYMFFFRHTHEFAAATCTEPATCVCGAIDETQPALGHDYTDWEIIDEATCVDTGEQTHSCQRCGYTETEIIPVNDNHQWGEAEVIKEATCAEEGELIHECLLCGKKLKESIPLTDDHVWKFEKIGNFTSLKDIQITYTCKICNTSKTEGLPKFSIKGF